MAKVETDRTDIRIDANEISPVVRELTIEIEADVELKNEDGEDPTIGTVTAHIRLRRE